MYKRIYVETSVISYLAARASNDRVKAVRQQQSLALWQAQDQFELIVSDTVIEEAVIGDASAVAERMKFCEQVPVLTVPPLAIALANRLIDEGVMPLKARTDALHIAVAAMHDVDFIASWNFRHIAGAVPRRKIEFALQEWGFASPIIATPEEILEI